jgi:hypothetical protein
MWKEDKPDFREIFSTVVQIAVFILGVASGRRKS